MLPTINTIANILSDTANINCHHYNHHPNQCHLCHNHSRKGTSSLPVSLFSKLHSSSTTAAFHAFTTVMGSVVCWACFSCMMRVQPSSEPPVERIFPLEFTWVLTPFPETLLDESINRGGLVCAHIHSMAWTQRILTLMSKRGECR